MLKEVNGKSVEEWAREFQKQEFTFNLSEEHAKIFMSFLYAELRGYDDKELTEILEAKQGGLASVIWLRVKHVHTYTITPAVAAFLGECLDNFGKTTMIVNYMQFIAHEKKLKQITLSSLGRYVIPNGFPTEESWEKMWNAQKVERKQSYETDNMLDRGGVFESISKID